MKNLFLYLFIAGFLFTSCGGGEETTDATDATDATEETTEQPAAGEQIQTDVVNNNNTAGEDVPAGPTTTVVFDNDSHDFGTIQEGEVVKHTFTFTNTGTEDFIISNAKGSCGCTVPYYPKEPIAPGGTGEIEVSFDSKGKKGTQRKSVTITANTDPNITVLNITSEVEAAEASAE